jgi:DNA-binding NtrC family response regulator
MFSELARLDGSTVNVLVTGESGVGKELVARAIHEGSSGPFVALNCAAISPSLILSELFGHARGAFTGAVNTRPGAFECANGGTLFLDEIGDLPVDVQPALLRALETGEVRPVGEQKSRHVRVRIVAATNRDLDDDVRLGRFREDLFFRLAVVRVHVPPLRERAEDIPLMAQAFAAAAAGAALPRPVLASLAERTWRGNVRELRNAVLAYLAVGDLPPPDGPRMAALDSAFAGLVDLARPYAEQKDAIAHRFTRVYLDALITRTGYNQSEAARRSGLDRTYLGRLLAKHRLGRD